MSKHLFTSTALGLTALAGAVQAQPATPSPAPEVREIVVTAQPFGVAEDALTSNVDVLTRDELDLSAPAGLGDALAGLPGVRSTFFGPGSSRPVVRGLAGPRVQVLTNGVGLIDASALSPDHQVAVDPLEATRIEVLRGPAVLAYGGSAIGGVINILDERIAETPAIGGIDGRLVGSASSVDDGHALAAFAKVGDGPWVLTVDAIRRDSDNYSVPVAPESRRLAELEGEEPEDADEVENSFVELDQIGTGLSYVSDRGFLGLSVKRTESRYGVIGHSHEHEHEGEEHEGEEGEEEGEEAPVSIDLEQLRVDLRGSVDYAFGPFASTRLSAGYADYEHTEFEGAEVGTVFLSEGLEGRLELVQRERDGWNGAVGVQALTRDFDAIGAEAYVGRTEIQELGLFTVQRVDRDTYGFEGGLRFDRRRLDNIAFGERDFTNVSTSGGVFVRPSEGVFLGVSAARNERAPDEAELFANGVHVATGQAEFGGAAQGLEFDSEVALSLEGSAHFERGRFDADAHVFVVKYDGFIDLRPNGELFGEDEEHDHEDEAHEGADEHGHEGEHDHGHEEGGVPVFNYVQTDADFYGFELEAGYDLFARDGRKIRLEGAADYVRGDTDLGPPARIPPWSVTGRLVYASEPINARVEVRRVGEQDRVAEFELPTDGYTLLNAFLSYKPFRGARGAEGVTLFLEGRNLTDEEAREHASFLKDLAPLPGRNLRAGVAWRF